MTDQEIIRKVIEKAIKNGWETSHISDIDEIESSIPWIMPHRIKYIIFSHHFAKAFWGEEKQCTKCFEEQGCYGWCEDGDKMLIWQYHLKIMVLEEDPIQYLEQFL